MANVDAPFGFRAIHPLPYLYVEATASKTWKKGDVLELASGLITNYASAARCCIAAEDQTDATTAGQLVPVEPPEQEFQVQCDSATAFVAATHNGRNCDFAGTTGVQELTLGTATADLFHVIRLESGLANNAVGQHAVVRVRVNLHTHAIAQPAA